MPWLWAPLVALLVISAALLPPREPSEGGGLAVALGLAERATPATGERYAIRALQEAIARQKDELEYNRLGDSLRAAARGPRAVHSADGSLTVLFETPVGADSARVWLHAAAGELGLYPSIGAGGIPVIVALYSNPARRRGQGNNYEWWTLRSREYAREQGDPCVVEVNLLSRRDFGYRQLIARDAAGAPIGRFLDECALYARFGVPGGAVRRWLAGRPWWWWGREPLAVRMQEAGRTIKPVTIQRAFDVTAQPWMASDPWREIGCLQGAAPLCSRLAGLSSLSSAGDERFYFYGSQYYTHGELLAYLLKTGSPAAFAAFWRSPLPTGRALEQAYGEPAGELAREAFSHWFSASEAGGPSVGDRAVAGGLVWVAVALAIALVAGRRWKVAG
ncbi:MAG TPA: hypothetical protein VMF70_04475 [Gemmatimonadales bacterium]|nr:hypothetical protein [Gemmatimonadales bacterium]